MGSKDTYGFLKPSLRDRACNEHFPTNSVYNDVLQCGDRGVNALSTAIAIADVPSVDWGQFKAWLLRKKLDATYVRRLVSGAKKWCRCLFSGNLSAVEMAGSKHMVLSALSQLSKYLGMYSYFKRLKEESGLKWHSSNNGFVFSRIYGEETAGVLGWLRKCCEKLEYEHWFPLKWMALSGLRTGEGYDSLEIVKNHGVDGYLSKELMVLEHFRYPKKFLRRSKKVFLSVVDDDILEELESYRGNTAYWKVAKKLRRHEMGMRTYDLRKAWGSFMVMNGVPESVVDMFQGRIATTVFQKSYFRPTMTEVVKQVRNVLQKYRRKMQIS